MPQQYSPPDSDNEFTIPTYVDVIDGETSFRAFADSIASPPDAGSRGVRRIFASTADPVASDGDDGDLWVKFIP